MPATDARTETAPWVRLAIPLELLGRLIESGVLCAADVRCLDQPSKAAVQQLCLMRCAKCFRLAEPLSVPSEIDQPTCPTTQARVVGPG